MDSEVVRLMGKLQLSVTETGGVDLDLRDIRESSDLCGSSLVGRIIGDFAVNYTGLKQTMTQLWCDEGALTVIELKNKMFQFVFTKEEERNRVLSKRPWTFDNQLLVLHQWRKGIDADSSVFSSSPMWIQAWGIPSEWLSRESIWKIGGIFSKCSKVVIPESGSTEGRYAKLLVEVDLTKPLVRGTNLRCNGEACWVNFKYENLPLFCFYCGIVGHGEKRCGKKREDSQQSVLIDGQFGEWLRAIKGRGLFNKNNGGLKEVAPHGVHRRQEDVLGARVNKMGS